MCRWAGWEKKRRGTYRISTALWATTRAIDFGQIGNQFGGCADTVVYDQSRPVRSIPITLGFTLLPLWGQISSDLRFTMFKSSMGSNQKRRVGPSCYALTIVYAVTTSRHRWLYHSCPRGRHFPPRCRLPARKNDTALCIINIIRHCSNSQLFVFDFKFPSFCLLLLLQTVPIIGGQHLIAMRSWVDCGDCNDSPTGAPRRMYIAWRGRSCGHDSSLSWAWKGQLWCELWRDGVFVPILRRCFFYWVVAV